ncbi:FAD-dependent oxidoreductase [Streptomyces sp. NBC_01474]|nr:FAD-dependent oxidoreductase [Streptomyces sp. NBC_01474]
MFQSAVARSVTSTTATALRSFHEDQGVRFHVNARIADVDAPVSNPASVELDDGTVVNADPLVICAGAEPMYNSRRSAGCRAYGVPSQRASR